VDLKTSDDPSAENWQRGGMYSPVVSLGYDLQLATYNEGLFAYNGRYCAAALIVVGSHEPHDVITVNMQKSLPIGQQKFYDALALYRQCRDTGIWLLPSQQGVVMWEPSRYDLPQGE